MPIFNHSNDTCISSLFDCVVIFAHSNFKPDIHNSSNYLTSQFEKYLPVVFVQPDLTEPKFQYEKIDESSTTIIHVYKIYGRVQSKLIRKALLSSYLIKPLFWIYNFLFIDFIARSYSPFKVFCAVNAYSTNDFSYTEDFDKAILVKLLNRIDLFVSASEIVRNSYFKSGFYTPQNIVLGTGNNSGYLFNNESFNLLQSKIINIIFERKPSNLPLSILILYDFQSIHVSTIKEHLESFIQFSSHSIDYISATGFADIPNSFDYYDTIIVHYSIRVNIEKYLSPVYTQALQNFGGYKVLFIQDEYDTTEIARIWIKNVGIHAVFTCVPDKYINYVYPNYRFPAIEFIQTLTGFVTQNLENLGYLKSVGEIQPTSERKLSIVYRGRKLPYWYGDLGQEKFEIGIKTKQICEDRKIPVDIECDDNKRIYGDSWYKFLASGKATLGTESGSNIFDDFGDIRSSIEFALKKNPKITYSEIHHKFLSENEGKVKMNQVSPKMFEAIALKTALILFEGDYSGILKPELHYISLKKDFSNIDEVLSKLQDNQYLEELVNRAYDDIVASGKYSYQKFINEFDKFLSERVSIRKKYPSFILEECLASLEEQQKIDSLKLLFISAIKNPSFWTDLLISNIQIVKLKLQSLWFRLKQIIKKLLRKVR